MKIKMIDPSILSVLQTYVADSTLRPLRKDFEVNGCVVNTRIYVN